LAVSAGASPDAGTAGPAVALVRLQARVRIRRAEKNKAVKSSRLFIMVFLLPF
jgi:hypothetical protein